MLQRVSNNHNLTDAPQGAPNLVNAGLSANWVLRAGAIATPLGRSGANASKTQSVSGITETTQVSPPPHRVIIGIDPVGFSEHVVSAFTSELRPDD